MDRRILHSGKEKRNGPSYWQVTTQPTNTSGRKQNGHPRGRPAPDSWPPRGPHRRYIRCGGVASCINTPRPRRAGHPLSSSQSLSRASCSPPSTFVLHPAMASSLAGSALSFATPVKVRSPHPPPCSAVHRSIDSSIRVPDWFLGAGGSFFFFELSAWSRACFFGRSVGLASCPLVERFRWENGEKFSFFFFFYPFRFRVGGTSAFVCVYWSILYSRSEQICLLCRLKRLQYTCIRMKFPPC